MKPARVFIGAVMIAAFVFLSLLLMPPVGPTERFVLPPGYSGPVIAIYNQTGGSLPERSGDTLVYKVPPTGVLRIAGAQPLPGSDVRFAFPGSADLLESIGVCSSHHLAPPPEDRTRVCWPDLDVGGTNIPYHIIGVVSDTKTIAVNYDRTMALHDSVVFNRRGYSTGTWGSLVDFETKKAQRRQKR